MLLQTKNGVEYLYSPLFQKYGIPHAFTTKRGGVSSGAFDSLNVSTRRYDKSGNTDKYENTVENFSRVLSLVGATVEKSACAHQVHGNRIIRLYKDFCGMGILKSAKINVDGDGLYVKSKADGIEAICVKSADCTPILLADKASGSVCAVHSGWRGTVQNIVGEAVKTMVDNGSRYEDILCCVGPCIGACCYEVSEDVYTNAMETLRSKNAENLAAELFLNRRTTNQGVKFDFNIGKMCAKLAQLSGIPVDNIDFLDICTCCSEDEKGRIFFSHRGQKGYSGTFASIIAPFNP